jgi:hypothetical protein
MASPRGTHPSPTPAARMAVAARPPVQTTRAVHEGMLLVPSSGKRTRARRPRPSPNRGKARRLEGLKVNFWRVTV